MKISVQMKVSPKTIVTVEGEKVKEIHAALAQLSEVYAEPCCGLCKSTSVIPNHRVAGKYQYYELKCVDCNARLALGQPNEGGGLYPKRKLGPDGQPTKTDDPKGKTGAHRGWHKFDPQAVP